MADINARAAIFYKLKNLTAGFTCQTITTEKLIDCSLSKYSTKIWKMYLPWRNILIILNEDSLNVHGIASILWIYHTNVTLAPEVRFQNT